MGTSYPVMPKLETWLEVKERGVCGRGQGEYLREREMLLGNDMKVLCCCVQYRKRHTHWRLMTPQLLPAAKMEAMQL